MNQLIVTYQQLGLNKANYNLNDSIYGAVKFKSIEENIKNPQPIKHFAKGYFRAKVEKR